MSGISKVAWIATCLTLAPGAAAQQMALEEVVVAARRIAENSQTVPISMSVLSSEELDSANIFDFSEIDRIVPSLQLGSNSPASATLKIRNVGPDFFALAFPAAVAVYVDGVPQAQPGSVFSTMLDIERIEVLNGPQGTLYGKNAPAGLISLYTVNPSMNDFGGYINSNLSSWDTWNNTAAINIPLIEDKLAMRVAGMYARSDGYMDNAIAGVKEANGKDHTGYRVKLLWRPSEDLELLLSYYNADLTTDDNGQGYEGRVPDDSGLTAFSSSYEDYDVFKAVPSYSETNVDEFNLSLVWALDTVNFSLLGQYQDLDIFQQQDNTNQRVVPPPDVPQDFLEFDPVAYSVEIRADGEWGDNLSYLFGAIYSDDQTSTINSINQINIVGASQTQSAGIFTNWTYRINDAWDTSLGVRYTNVEYDSLVFGVIPGLGELNTEGTQNFSDPSYSFKLRYYPLPDVLAYFGIDTAFRSGGVNVLAPLAGQLSTIFTQPPVSDNLRTISENYAVFTQEDSIAYEIGMKGTFLEQRLRWNVSAFIQAYDDHQYRTSPSEAAVTPVLSSALSNLAVNVEELEVYGFETEFDYLFNEHWSISTTAAYAKPEIQEYTKRMCEEGEADGGQLICAGEAGEQLNDEPLLHVFSQLRFTHPLAETGWEFFGILAAEYYDKPYQAVKTPNIKEIMIYDLTLGIADLDGQWTVKFWSRNITDETVLLSESVEEQEIIDPVLGPVTEFLGYSASPRAPRSFGVTAEYRF